MPSTENNYVATDLGNIALNPCGEYSKSTLYEYLDMVSYQGGSYFCKVDFPQKISGIAPEPGKNTEHWQMLTMPGGLTSDYIAMHDDVVNKTKQVETSRAAVELSQQEVEDAQADVSQMRQDTQEASEEAAVSRDSAAGHAQSAEASRTAAKESEDNINAQVVGFDTHVTEKTSAAETAVGEARKTAIDAITTQQDVSTKAVTDEGTTQTNRVEGTGNTAVSAVAKQQAASVQAVENAGTAQVTAIESAGDEQITEVNKAGTVQVENVEEAAKQQNVNITEAGAQELIKLQAVAKQFAEDHEQIETNKEDISNKITKFYASNQGETHITDSDNGKIMDMMVYGKSSQDGTPSPENPVEIKSVVNPTIKLFGSNILKINDGEYQNDGVTITVSNGVIKAKGTFNSKSDFMLEGNLPMYFKEGTEIIVSPNNVNGTEKQNNCYIDFTNNNTVGFSIKSNNINTPYTIKERDTKYPFYLFLRFNEETTLDEIWKPQILIGKTSTTFKPYTEQTITLPITLNAIPVSSGGNVTINGQQYVADYVDVERGKVVRMCGRETLNTKNGEINEEYRLAIYPGIHAHDDGSKECIFSRFEWKSWETCMAGGAVYIKNIKKTNNEFYTAQELKELSLDFDVVYQLLEQQETDLTKEEIEAFKELATYYPVTNVSVNSEQLDGYTVFNYPISMANGWNYVKQQLNDNRDYIYDMDLQSAEAYVNSEYAVALTELEV